jgi:hypothetical protein
MLLTTTHHRFHPRSADENDKARREIALRAQVTDLMAHVGNIEREQQTQFKRIVEIQQQLDEIKRLIQDVTKR